ncbi:hypothetical protein ALC60_09984 [Trachymyrmex zeteki]|uniref:Uncharacterized protein n=1 Tax=Mycetomoellerius zeteki TaxID=64791 RepID=A0A151WT84_9HYME|nr:hypothetical protein ALC60_09984 [Trachymyrmex zeteki]
MKNKPNLPNIASSDSSGESQRGEKASVAFLGKIPNVFELATVIECLRTCGAVILNIIELAADTERFYVLTCVDMSSASKLYVDAESESQISLELETRTFWFYSGCATFFDSN